MARARRGRHEGNIYLRDDGRWHGRLSVGYDAEGRRIRRSVYGKTKQEVIDAMAELRVTPPVAAQSTAGRFTLAEYVPQWLAALRAQGRLRPNTLAYYEVHVRKHALPILGGLQLAKIKPHNIETLLAGIESARTREATYEALRSVFRIAERRGLVTENPMTRIPKPRRSKQHKVRIWSPQEARKFLTAAESSPWFGVYALALGAGLRRGEIFGLRWRDLDLEAGTVRVERALIEVSGKLSFGLPKTESGARTVELPAFAIEALKAKRAELGDPEADALIFTHSNGTPVRRSNFDRRVHHPLLAKAQVPRRTMHELRHSHASLLLAAGESIKLVSLRLGHSDTAVTAEVYAHLMPGADREAAARIDSALSQPTARSGRAARQLRSTRPSRRRSHGNV